MSAGLEAIAFKFTRKGSRQVWYGLSYDPSRNPSKPVRLAKKGDENYTIDVTVDDLNNNFVGVND